MVEDQEIVSESSEFLSRIMAISTTFLKVTYADLARLKYSLSYMGLCLIVFELYRPGALKLELFHTDEDTIKMGRGYLFVLPEKECEGVKALVKSPA
jgi:hypothetical protein